MFKLPKEYDVIVIGSGHAGIEAALAAARIGCRNPDVDPKSRYDWPNVMQPSHWRFG